MQSACWDRCHAAGSELPNTAAPVSICRYCGRPSARRTRGKLLRRSARRLVVRHHERVASLDCNESADNHCLMRLMEAGSWSRRSLGVQDQPVSVALLVPGQIIHRSLNAARLVRHASGTQTDLHAAQRADQLKIAEIAQMADAEHALLQDAEPVPQAHVALLEDGRPQCIGTVALR